MFNLSLYIFPATLILLLVGAMLIVSYVYKTYLMNKQLVKANEAKDKLIGIIGHELNNPIGGVARLLALLEEDEKIDPLELKEMIPAMRKQMDASLNILHSLLIWGKTQLKGPQINRVSFSVNPVVEKNVQLLRQSSAGKQLEISTRIAPALTAFGDADHFDFIIRNLLSNAVKFSFPSGKIEIDAKLTHTHHEVLFSVKDFGKGMSKDQLQAFSKSNMKVEFGTTGEKGSGIGLMICKEFINAARGKMWFASEKGQGTTAYFTFRSERFG
jgi:signal transduction histidine kinase